MKNLLIFFGIMVISRPAAAQTPTAEEILKKIDDNLVLDQAVVTSRMIIHGRRGSRTIKSRSWIKGPDKAFVEYLSPARDRGKKMLRLDGKLWNYIPEPVDRIITISGNLLRQSVMGSDLSYEDITENRKLADLYRSEIIGRENLQGRPCLVLKLTAKVKDAAYHSRKVWVDTRCWLPLKEERYARSGRLLKTTEITELFKIGNRWYPKKMIFKDMLSRGKGTEYIIESIDLNASIPDYRFTKAALRE